ncbi:MAG TPA: ATP-binding protein [Methylomirabilota bacterium]|nr:ATP-binding protein [Methylomirabilota bacterium]
MTRRETRTFEARLADASALSAFVQAAVTDPELSFKSRLAAEELFVNTVSHGHGGDSEGRVEVTLAIEPDAVVLTYVDAAPPYNPFETVADPDLEAPVEERMVGGLGIFMITKLARHYDYARVGAHNRITLELRRSGR